MRGEAPQNTLFPRNTDWILERHSDWFFAERFTLAVIISKLPNTLRAMHK